MIGRKIVALACITLLGTVIFHGAFHHHDDHASPTDCTSCLLLLVSHAMDQVVPPAVPAPEPGTIVATDCSPCAPARPDSTATLLRAPPVDRTA